MRRQWLASVAVVAAACCVLLWAPPERSGAGPARSEVGITLQSVFTSTREIPTAWVEVLIFGKDPYSIEFFERPRLRLAEDQGRVFEVNPADFPAQKMWLVYRFDETAAEAARGADPNGRRLYETHKDAAWLFELPATPDLTQISIDGANLAYTLRGTGGRRTIAGAAFRAPLPRYGGARKGAQGYIRIDHLAQVGFEREAADLNRSLPEALRIDPTNTRIWPGDAVLHVTPATLAGQRYFGPREYDRPAVDRGYTPVFIVLSNLTGDVILRRQPPWAAVERGGGELLTDLPRQDPELWARLSQQVQTRYQAPARIAAGGETRLVLLWKREPDAAARFFALYIQRPGGDEFRTVLFRLLAANAR